MKAVVHNARQLTDSESRDGSRQGFTGTTKSVSAEENRALERERFRAIIDNLPDCLYVKDTQSRFVLNNLAHAQVLGVRTPEDLVGKTDFDFSSHDAAARFRAEEEQILQSGRPMLNQVRLRPDKSGNNRWVSVSKVPWRDSQGRVVGVVGITRDVHETKLAEEALHKPERLYRTLIDSLPQHVVFKDRESVFVSVNAGFAKFVGKHSEELIGKTDFDLFPRELAERHRAADQRVMNSRQIEVIEEVDVVNGHQRVMEVTKLPVTGEDGNVMGLLGIFSDITERKLAEEKLREFNTQLERSNRELQDFAYVASHDLQEPLRKIVVFGDRLREKCGASLVAEASDYLERMQKAARRMQVLITDLLTFSRVTTKAQPFRPVNLATMASEIVSDLEGRIEQVKGRVEFGPLPVINAEPVQMRQLLQNLIGNALKFHPPGQAPVVRVAAQTVFGLRPRNGTGALEEELCQLTISDNGIGFDEKYLDRIFNVFQRLHSRTEYEGTGMGLAICRKIAHHHGGEITARSQPGHGATFIVTLPLVHPNNHAHG